MIVRERLSTDVHQELLGRIIRGELSPGLRVRDSELAEELGVSRTPVREALLRLEREGFVTSQKHLGFSVKTLQQSEICELYPLVRILECAALDMAPLPSQAQFRRLGELGSALKEKCEDPLRRIELDSAWHGTIVENSGNRQLGRILAELKRLLMRYEYAFMRDDSLVSESALEHEAIADSLARGDKARASSLLAAHWDRCTAATLADFVARSCAS